MRRRPIVALLPALLAGCVALPSADARSLVPCRFFDYGPARSAKPVAVCVEYGPRVSVSADRGRTWTAPVSSSGTPDAVDHLMSVLVSPAYDTDHTIYLLYQSLGLFGSTDGGATFTAVDPQGGNAAGDRATAIDSFGAGVVAATDGPAVALPNRGPAVLYAGQHVPVAGSGHQQDRGFYQLGHDANGVVLDVSTGPDESLTQRLYVSRCTAQLACPGGQTFPKDISLVQLAVDPAASAKTAVALTAAGYSVPVLWASTDRGATFGRVTGFDKAVARYLPGGHTNFIYSVAVLPGGRTWLVEFGTTKDSVLLVSTDSGRTWGRRSYPGPIRLTAAPDGRLFASANVFQCSLDQGRHWSDRCAR
jgi:hypothetical protein